MQEGEKSKIASIDSLKPAAIQFTHRSLPGNQDVFSLLISCSCIHKNPGKWLIIFIIYPVKHNGYKYSIGVHDGWDILFFKLYILKLPGCKMVKLCSTVASVNYC